MRLAAIPVAVVVLLGGCGAEDSEPGLSESIIGTWASENGVYVTFDDDGTYDVGTQVGVADREFGAWSVEGSVLTKVTDEDSRYCAGIVGLYETAVLADGERLESTVVDDECPKRVADFLILTRPTETES